MLVRAFSSVYSGLRGLAFDHDHAGPVPQGAACELARLSTGAAAYSMSNASQSGFGSAHFHGESARQLALAALPAPRGCRRPGASPKAACRMVRRSASADTSVTDDAREGEDAASARDDLHLAFHLLQNRAMQQQQFVGIGRAEHALGPAMEAALDGFLDFRKKAHG